MITLEVNGTEFGDFISASCNRSMLEFNNEASFVIAADKNERVPFLGNEACTVLIDGQKVMTGFIDSIQINYSSNSHQISYIVRDKTADFSDSSIDAINDLSGSLSLKKVIEIIISHLGLSDIKVIVDEKANLKPFDLSVDDIIPEVGENCFEYVEKLARKRQVLLTTDPDGNIRIIRNSGKIYETDLQNVYDNLDDNNILNGQYTYTMVNSFRTYIVKSQLGTASDVLSFKPKEISNQNGKFEDLGIRKGRQKVIISPETSTSKENQDQAKWQADYERSKSLVYTVKVLGHSLLEELYEPNKIIKVVDNFCDVDENLLLEAVEYSFDTKRGSISTLKLTDAEAFSLLVTQPEDKPLKKKESDQLVLQPPA